VDGVESGEGIPLSTTMTTGPKILYEFGPFQVDPAKQVLLRENQPVAITPKVFETLLILVRHSRDVVTKDDLIKGVWPDSFVEESNLSQNIFVLRKALGDTPEDRRYIATIPGRGYRFVAEVRTVGQDGDDVLISSSFRSQMMVPHLSSRHRRTFFYRHKPRVGPKTRSFIRTTVRNCRRH
jgi:DNA-binding winged helix-turn-helix (wHTH) protein